MLKKRWKDVKTLLAGASKKFKEDDPIRLAGTTAYFTVFAVAPIIIIIVSVIGLLLGEETIREKAYEELEGLINEEGTEYIKSLVSNYQGTQKNITGTIIGVIIFLITSTTFFTVLQKSLNFVWRIRAKPSRNLIKTLKDRLLSFGLILSLGFIMVISLLIDAGLSILDDFLQNKFPYITVILMKTGNFLLSFAVVMVIFAMIYKFLPDAVIKWKVVWFGSFITTLLFTLGKFLIGFALGNSNIGVMYGAAGSLVVILLWVFYSSLIFFYGAEITQQYAEQFSHTILPKKNAVQIKISEVEKK
ncbi:MAG: YihY/virulence factor BrkB family protein [Bacteroidota bacterium]